MRARGVGLGHAAFVDRKRRQRLAFRGVNAKGMRRYAPATDPCRGSNSPAQAQGGPARLKRKRFSSLLALRTSWSGKIGPPQIKLEVFPEKALPPDAKGPPARRSDEILRTDGTKAWSEIRFQSEAFRVSEPNCVRGSDASRRAERKCAGKHSLHYNCAKRKTSLRIFGSHVLLSGLA